MNNSAAYFPRLVGYFLLTNLLTLAYSPSTAQEIQRSFDEAGAVQTIDAELEKKLELFPDYEEFQEARLFETGNANYVLEIVYRSDDQTLRDRQTLTPAEVEDLRARVTQRYNQVMNRPAVNQQGRTELLVNSTLLSLGFYGYALPLSLDIESGTASTAMYMLTSGAGFFGPYLWTRARPVTEGQAKLFQYGGTRGIAHGAFIGLLGAGDDLSTEGFFGAALLTSVTEGLLGYAFADAQQLTQGSAETIVVRGDFGLGLGLGTAYLIEEETPDIRLVAGPSLLGSTVGLIAGHHLSRSTTYSTGDARVLRLMGGIGGLLGLTAMDLTGTGNTRALVGATMATSLAGLGVSHRMLRNKNFSGSDGTYITLGTLGGMLTGVGIAYIITGDDIEDEAETPFLTLSSLGATAGFTLMYRTFVDDARTRQTGWRIQLNPSGLAARWLSERSNPQSVAPIVQIRKSF